MVDSRHVTKWILSSGCNHWKIAIILEGLQELPWIKRKGDGSWKPHFEVKDIRE
jgi:hypothetical protein